MYTHLQLCYFFKGPFCGEDKAKQGGIRCFILCNLLQVITELTIQLVHLDAYCLDCVACRTLRWHYTSQFAGGNAVAGIGWLCRLPTAMPRRQKRQMAKD